jgi:hypothetical protein
VLSHLRAAPGVYRGDPAWRCAAAGAVAGACRMSGGPQGEAWQGAGAPAGGAGGAGGGLRAGAGRPKRLGTVTALAPTALLQPLAGGSPLG